ncbi:MAG: SpoIID/LytB domain-containing protein [candidate division WOR-3 bacterium]
MRTPVLGLILVVMIIAGCYQPAVVYQRYQQSEHIPEPFLVRVRLTVPDSGVVISAEPELQVRIGGRAWKSKRVRVIFQPRGFRLADGDLPPQVFRDTAVITSGSGLLRVGSRCYRGAVLVFFLSDSGRTVVVNRLPLEEYLYSVVPCEIGPVNPETYEAVKAQAVAARSFTLSRLGRREGLGYDLYDSYLRDQEYRGAGAELVLASRAVDETRGEVLMYQNEVAEALYHGNCGGVTADGANPSLISVRDSQGAGGRPFCSWSGNFSWRMSIGLDSIERTLARLSGRSGRIRVKGVRLMRDNESHRVQKLYFKTDRGELTVNGADLRLALGLKSTCFELRISRGKAIFEGKGWGHGVGMCQDGAVGMSRLGYDYRQILKHYYPRLKLGRWY